MSAELYQFDENGKRIKPKSNADVRCHSCGVMQRNCPRGKPGSRCCANCWHPQIMRVRARPNSGVDIDSLEPTPEEIERAEREHAKTKRNRALDSLTPEERAVFELKQEQVSKTQTREIAVEELDRAIEQGWNIDHQVSDTLIVTREVFVRMSYEQIGHRLGLTARQVHRRIVSMREKLRVK